MRRWRIILIALLLIALSVGVATYAVGRSHRQVDVDEISRQSIEVDHRVIALCKERATATQKDETRLHQIKAELALLSIEQKKLQKELQEASTPLLRKFLQLFRDPSPR
jgi:uncharacterized protein HemX